MKNKNIIFLFIALLAISFVACENIESEIESAGQNDILAMFAENNSEYAVSPTEALSALEEFLSVIDGQSGVLRSSGKSRTIKSVETIYQKKDNSLRAVTTQQPMLYVVDFENDEGYAVLAADTRIKSPVVALVEEGNSKTEEEWEPYDSQIDYGYELLENFNLYNAEEDDYYVAAAVSPLLLIKEYAQLCCDESDSSSSGGNSSSTTEVTDPWVIDNQIHAMLTTTWHQHSPFNDCAPKMRWFFWQSYKRSPAGCVPIAVSQIMAYHEYPSRISGLNFDINWNRMKYISSIYKGAPTGNDSIVVASIVHNVGCLCKLIYSPDWAFATPSGAKSCFEKCSYKNVKGHLGHDEGKILGMIKNGNPVFMAAISGVVSGHAWVVDGAIERSQTTKTVNKATGAVVSSSTKKEVLFHCNWGWGSKANGYYTSGVFNTKKGPVDREEYEQKWGATGSSNFSWGFHYITYDNPYK